MCGETCVGSREQCLLFVWDLNTNLNILIDFIKNPRYEIS
jgi:hypothetical protein